MARGMSKGRDGRLGLLLLGCAVFYAPCASAALIQGTGTTMVVAGDVPIEGSLRRVAPVSELIWVRTRDFGHYGFDELAIEVQGWVLGQPTNPPGFDAVTGDVDVAYIDGALLDRRLRLRLGRQLILGGAARNLQMDGIDGRVRLGDHFEGAFYWGRAVRPRFQFKWADYVVGTRLVWREVAGTDFGVSFIRQQDDGQLARQDAGADLSYAVTDWLSVFGAVVVATTQERVSEIDAHLDWHSWGAFQLLAGYQQTAPDLFLPLNSIMTVFAQEEERQFGGTFYYKPFWMLRTRGGFHYVMLDEGNGTRSELRADVYLDEDYRTRLGVGVMGLAIPTNQYLLPRLDASHRMTSRFTMSGNVEGYVLKDAINDRAYSITGLLAGTYDITDHWTGTLAAYGGTTPFIDKQWQVMAKVSYGLQPGITAEVQ